MTVIATLRFSRRGRHWPVLSSAPEQRTDCRRTHDGLMAKWSRGNTPGRRPWRRPRRRVGLGDGAASRAGDEIKPAPRIVWGKLAGWGNPLCWGDAVGGARRQQAEAEVDFWIGMCDEGSGGRPDGNEPVDRSRLDRASAGS